MSRLVPSLVLLGSLLPAPALACGGFFCFTQPVDQSKERIVFGIDEASGEVDVHVQIFYQGEAQKFSWIVPVPAVPTVELSTDALFAQLAWQTAPSFQLQYEQRGECTYNLGGGGWYDEDDVAESADSGGVGSGGGVEVFASGQTGPFDWVVVGAKDAQSLLDWLADPNSDGDLADGYTIPPEMGSKMAPYLSNDGKFVAFKLQKDADVGDIAPIRLQYRSDKASIPLVLTSVAATPDMRLEPYIFSNKRAVPENYLHVQINEAAVNWLSGGSNYEEVVTRAANEAGGQAFATDFYGPTTSFRDQLYQEGRFDLAALRAETSPEAFVMALLSQGFPRDATMQNLLREFIPMPASLVEQGVTEQEFYNCLSCYAAEVAGLTFDPVAFVAALEERVVTPLREAEALFHDHAQLTRLTSSMSPDEMTADPLFVLNADMADPVSNVHRANLVIDCTSGGEYIEAPRWIELSDGRTIEVPPETWFQEDTNRYESWVDEADQPAAYAVEQTGSSGQPAPISDASGSANANLDDYNAWVRGLTGRDAEGDPEDVTAACGGCQQSGGGSALAGLLGGLALGLRRRSGRTASQG